MDIRYFFIKDRVKSEGLEIQYCPTEEMLADFYTKPLQGALFRKFRAVLLGEQPVSSLKRTPSVTSEERVGEHVTTGQVPDQDERDERSTYQSSTTSEARGRRKTPVVRFAHSERVTQQ